MEFSRGRFSPEMYEAMRYAKKYAKESGGILGTEHIMAGIMSIDCDVSRLLQKYGVTKRFILEDVLRLGNPSPDAMLSKRCHAMLEEAKSQTPDGIITPAVAMLLILNSTGSVAVRGLLSIGVDIFKLGLELKHMIMSESSGNFSFEDSDALDDGLSFSVGGTITPESILGAFGEGGMDSIFGGEDAPSGETKDADNYDAELPKALQGICHDLTAKAKAGKLDPVIGRGKEIDRIIQILSRRTKNNPVLIGEAGVGKTAIVEGLCQAIVDGEVPDILLDKRVLSLDITSVVAGAQYRGQFEERLQKAIAEVEKDKHIILFIDELHTIVGAGASEGSLDAANILKPMLARGELHMIGATTIDEYRKHIEKDPALERRFQPITVDPPSVEDTIVILTGIREKYEKHHGVTITDSAVKAAAELSDRYISDRYLPDKAIDLIDEAASKKRINNFVTPDNIKELEDKIQRREADIKSAVRREDFDSAKKFKKEREELKEQVAAEKKKWAESRKDVQLSIDENDIAAIISDWTKIPVTKLTEKESDRLLKLEEILHKRVIGQDDAVVSVAKAVRRARAGLQDPKKPIGSFIFLGPTGVGKTELCKALAEAMFGDEDLLIRIDMSEYMEKFNVSRLIGAAPGYVGFEEGGQLTEQVRRKPYSVVLFDEIEKAHPDVFNILLQVLDDGRLTDSQGRVVSFKNTIIIMTSNIGAGEIKSTKLGFGQSNSEADFDAMKDRQMEALKRAMKPEFINRIDDIVIFKSLDKADTRKIADVLLAGLMKRLKTKNIEVDITDAAKDFVVDKGYNSEYGARPLKRAIQKNVEDALSEQILMGKVSIGDHVVIDCKDGALTFESKKAE